jgi:hypothetical protein
VRVNHIVGTFFGRSMTLSGELAGAAPGAAAGIAPGAPGKKKGGVLAPPSLLTVVTGTGAYSWA